MASNTRNQLEEYIKTIDVLDGSLVLDIGGSQLPIKGRTKSWGKNIKYDIVDLEKPHIQKQKPNVIMDIQNPFGNNIPAQHYSINKVDMIFCIEVMEYIIDPINTLKNIWFMLKPGGILYISFHFIYPHHNPMYEDCLRYTTWGVNKLLKKTGFKILEKKTRYASDKNILHLRMFYITEGMRGNYEAVDPIEIGWIVKAQKEG